MYKSKCPPKKRLYPGFATADGPFSDPKRCGYCTGAAQCKCAEFGRFLYKRIGVMESVADQVPDCVWTVRGLRRKRRPCAQRMDSRNELETPCSVEGGCPSSAHTSPPTAHTPPGTARWHERAVPQQQADEFLAHFRCEIRIDPFFCSL